MLQEICKSPSDVAVYSTGQRAHRACQRVISDLISSDVVDVKLVDSVVRLECEEVLLGDLLGTGNFCHVSQVHQLDFKPVKNMVQVRQRQKMQTGSTKGKYAIKFLRNDLNPNQYCQGAAELVLEMLLLSSLNHSNIISLAGVSKEGPAGFESGNGYFIVIDRLGNTLDQQIPIWRDMDRRHQCDAAARQSMFVRRLTVTAEIASALSYLHSKNILYRGIDPTNFAFNEKGRIVLFDMGLARKLDKSRLSGDGENYELSGNKGNIQYMAPEVGMCRPYGLRADVYGIAVLLWQVCALEPFPFPGVKSIDHFLESIVQKKERPIVNRSWPDTLKYLIQSSWADEPSVRPPMNHFYRNLLLEIEDIQATLPRSTPSDLLRTADSTATLSQSPFSLGMAQHSTYSPTRPPKSTAATDPALPHGTTAMTRRRAPTAGGDPSPNGGKSHNNPAPPTLPTKGIVRHRRPTFGENEAAKDVDSSMQAQKIVGSPQSSEDVARSMFERYAQQNAQYQTLEDKLRVVNAAFDVLGPQDTTATSSGRTKSPTSSLDSSLEEKCGVVTDPPHSNLMRRSTSLVVRSAPAVGNARQLSKSWIQETNPVLREHRAKKWQQAHGAEKKANPTANTDVRVAGDDKQAPPLQRRTLSPKLVERDRSTIRHRHSASITIRPTREHAGRIGLESGIQETAVPFKGSPVRAKSLTAMDAIRSRVLTIDSGAMPRRHDHATSAPGVPCQDVGNKTKR